MPFLSIFYIFSIIGSLWYLIQSEYPKELELEIPEQQPLVSIIIPTRNEERNIGRLLESLNNLNYKNREIIVVDGHSTDKTREICASNLDVELIVEPDRPRGWVGKPWACYTGYEKANGEIILFTDADTWHHPDSLDATVSKLQQSDGFLSFLTTQEFGSFWEHLLAIVFLIISISVRGTKGTGKAQIANGQYMMFTKEVYEKLGTHKVVANSIIEDLAFATHAKEQGLPPTIPSHHNLVTTRMYQGLAEIQEGFGKNLALGVGKTGIDSIIGTGFLTIWGLGWVILIMVDILTIRSISTLTLVITAVGYLNFALMLYRLEKNLSTRGTAYVLFYPIYFIVFHVIVVYSLFNTYIKREIIWKDQSYSV